ncbi:hypothetical protein ACN24K_06480 [Streptomyces microflavus]
MQRQQHQHEKGECIADTADELGAPQPLQRGNTQQGSYGALA